MRIGLVGSGGMGTVHYMNYKEIPGAEVVALVGSGEMDQVKAKKWALPFYESIEEMSAKEKPDLVDICTPTFLHAKHVENALNLNHHVIVEKPFTLRQEVAERLMRLAESKNLKIYVGQVLQFMPETQFLRQAVAEKQFGRVLWGRFERLSAKPHWSSSWFFDPEKSGLIPFDLHIHDADLIVSMFGVPERESVRMTKRRAETIPEQVNLRYSYGGFDIEAEAAWFEAPAFPFTARWRVYFEEAKVIFENGKLIVYGRDGSAEEIDISYERLIPTGINLPPTGAFYNELSHFVELAEKNEYALEVMPKQVIEVIGLLNRIRQAE